MQQKPSNRTNQQNKVQVNYGQADSAWQHGNQFLNDGVNSTPQATAVKLAQLGEGDSPQCGEMSA